MRLGKDLVAGEIVLGEHRPGAQALVEHRPAIARRIMIRERSPAARGAVVLGELRDAIQRIDAGLRPLERGGADVGAVEEGPLLQPLLAEQDGERIEFLAVRAARDPHLERREGAQMRHHLFADRAEIGRVAEHLAHLDGEEAHQLGEQRRLAQHPPLQLRQGIAAEARLRPLQPPPQRAARIAAKVMVIAPPDRVEQQLELQRVHRIRGVAHRGIHTRTRLSSLSTSSGLAR